MQYPFKTLAVMALHSSQFVVALSTNLSFIYVSLTLLTIKNVRWLFNLFLCLRYVLTESHFQALFLITCPRYYKSKTKFLLPETSASSASIFASIYSDRRGLILYNTSLLIYFVLKISCYLIFYLDLGKLLSLFQCRFRYQYCIFLSVL